MATCNECLHYEVCYIVEDYGSSPNEDGMEHCYHFEDRNKYEKVLRCLANHEDTEINPDEIIKLKNKLDAAEQCIYCIEDALDRGSDNDWAREAIEEWEMRYEDGK